LATLNEITRSSLACSRENNIKEEMTTKGKEIGILHTLDKLHSNQALIILPYCDELDIDLRI